MHKSCFMGHVILWILASWPARGATAESFVAQRLDCPHVNTTDASHGLRWSSDGALLTSAGDKSCVIHVTDHFSHKLSTGLLVWSKDGRTAVGYEYPQDVMAAVQLTVVDTATGTVRARRAVAAARPENIALSDDGAYVAFQEQQKVRVMHSADLTQVTSVRLGGGVMAGFWPGHHWLVLLEQQGAVSTRLFDVDAQRDRPFACALDEDSLAWSPDGRWVASLDARAQVMVCAADGELVWRAHTRGATTVLDWSPDATRVLVRERGGVALLDASTGQVVQRADLPDPVAALFAFSAGHDLLVGRTPLQRVTDDAVTPVASVGERRVEQVAMSADGLWVAAALSGPNEVMILSLADDALVWRTPVYVPARRVSLAWAPSGRALAYMAGGNTYLAALGPHQADVATDARVEHYTCGAGPAQPGLAHGVSWSRDGNYVWSNDAAACVVAVQEHRLLPLAHAERVHDMAPNNRTLVATTSVGAYARSLQVWDVPELRAQHVLARPDEVSAIASLGKYSDSGNFFAMRAPLRVFDTHTWRLSCAAAYGAFAPFWQPGGDLLILAQENHAPTTTLFDPSTCQAVARVQGHTWGMGDAFSAWSPDGRMFFTVREQDVLIWDSHGRYMSGTRLPSPPMAKVWAQDGQRFAVLSVDGVVRVFDATAAHLLGHLAIPPQPVDSQLSFAGAGHLAVFAMSGADSTQPGLRLIDANLRDSFVLAMGTVKSAAFSPDGKQLAYTRSLETTVHVLDVATMAELWHADLQTPESTATWAPTGAYLAVNTEDGLVLWRSAH